MVKLRNRFATATYNQGMQTAEMLQAIPLLREQGLLSVAGGSLGCRTEEGVYVTPFQAALELHWQITVDDLVLFPRGGEASMARAGRRPCVDNRLHRIVLNANPSWSYSYVGNLPGLLSHALAGRDLPVPHEYGGIMQKTPRTELIPVTGKLALNTAELETHLTGLVKEHFNKAACGAVLVGGYGCVAAGQTLAQVGALFLILERLALAQR